MTPFSPTLDSIKEEDIDHGGKFARQDGGHNRLD